MASWSNTTKHEPGEINGGNQYALGDQVPIEQLNAITENAFYAIEHVASTDASNLTNENVKSWEEKLGLNSLTKLWGGTMSTTGTITLNHLLSNYKLVYFQARLSSGDLILQPVEPVALINGNQHQIVANNASDNRYIKITGTVAGSDTVLKVTDIDNISLVGVYV